MMLRQKQYPSKNMKKLCSQSPHLASLPQFSFYSFHQRVLSFESGQRQRQRQIQRKHKDKDKYKYKDKDRYANLITFHLLTLMTAMPAAKQSLYKSERDANAFVINISAASTAIVCSTTPVIHLK